MDETRRKAWEELDVTREELKTITDCMKKDEFRKLLSDYADEVNDPENRKIYQKEVTQLEKERGIDVTFVNPEPGYVIKTSIDGSMKCFLNISKNDAVGKPSSQPTFDQGNRGLQWTIPYTLAPPRDDLDKKRARCRVFDVVFHPDTLYLASKNSRFREVVNNTAMDGVENNFKVKLDRKNLRFPKLNYKGFSQPAVIRKPCEKPAEPSLDIEPEIYQKLMASYDESRTSHDKSYEEKPKRAPPSSKYFKDRSSNAENDDLVYTTPKYIIKHRTNIELNDFTNCRDAKMNSAMPKQLVVIVDLPLLRSATDADLDVQERYLQLKSDKPAKYSLEIELPYRVDPDNGNAKFDSKTKKLTVTLPVILNSTKILDTREDSGVDSDSGSPQRDSDLKQIDREIESVNSDLKKVEYDQSIESVNLNDVTEQTVVPSEFEMVCDKNNCWTSGYPEPETPFMNPNLKYSLPTCTCNLYDNTLAITIHVKNVDPNSICHRILNEHSGFHLILASIGAGFFPIYYSLCMKLEKDVVYEDCLTIEPWDNNVVLTIAVKNAENLTQYSTGLDEEFMELKHFSSSVSIRNKLMALVEETDQETDKNIEVVRSGDDVIVNVSSHNVELEVEEEHKLEEHPHESQWKPSLQKWRSVSESSGDELPNSLPSSHGSSGRFKGILKSRSISESSIDDSVTPVSSVNVHDDSVQEINSESECSSFKKTVRFNEIVSRQLYRSNSSILGQRKKNQRKLRNKKRAHDRRLSESENSETDEREKYKIHKKDTDEPECSDTVRPILNREKHPQSQQTASIEIEQTRKNCAITKRKTINKLKSSDALGQGDGVENETVADDAVQLEFTNDLLFELIL